MESVGNFPFRNISYNIYLLVEVMMNVDYEDALKFMFNVNKQGRKFLYNYFNTVRNGFMNDGLIDLRFGNYPNSQFNNYD